MTLLMSLIIVYLELHTKCTTTRFDRNLVGYVEEGVIPSGDSPEMNSNVCYLQLVSTPSVQVTRQRRLIGGKLMFENFLQES